MSPLPRRFRPLSSVIATALLVLSSSRAGRAG